MKKEDLVKKWLKNELTDDEKQVFEKLDDFELNTRIVETAKQFKASNVSSVDDFETFKNKYETSKDTSTKIKWLKPLFKVAAVLLIAFGVYFYFFSSGKTIVKTLVAEKINIELPDDSQVVLNALSQIEFNKKHWKTNREIKLNGEAFFKVEKGSQFKVVTQDGVVSVLGTQFNVKQRDNYFEVTCYEGSVKVSSRIISQVLASGEAFQMQDNKILNLETTLKTPQWVDKISSFKDVPFTVVIEELKRQYDIEVSLEDINAKRKFTGGFKHDNLNEALISITKPMGLKYKISSSNEVVIHANKN
ncbi:FecR family protein [Flavobacteriaceae bacterium GSB9]|nr:FecR family protein [Flavobacteriaceae bacterium GSB9]